MAAGPPKAGAVARDTRPTGLRGVCKLHGLLNVERGRDADSRHRLAACRLADLAMATLGFAKPT
jgi:hypothetical protein